MKQTISILLFLILSVCASAQLEINFESADTMPTAGSSINVDVTVGNFVDIVNLQYWIYWDSTVLAFDTITNLNSDISMQLDGFNYPGNPITVGGMMTQYPDGKIGVSWQDGLNTHTLDDGDVLFTITLDAVGLECDSTFMTIGDNPPFGEIEVYANFDFSEDGNLGAVSDGSDFMIPGNCGDDPDPPVCEFTYTLSQEQGEQDGQVCVFLSVEDFTNIESFQGGIYFDETVIEYDGFDFFNISTEFEGVAPIMDEPGVLSFLAVVDNVTVTDGTQVLKLIFNVIGDLGDMTDLTFGDAGNVIMEVSATNGFLDICTEPGSVVVVEEIVETITLDLPDQTVTNGENFCFPLVVNNFIDITTLQFAVEWDPAVYTFTGVQNLNSDIQIVDGSHLNVNMSGTLLICSWTSSTGLGMSLADGSVLFEVCLDVNANCTDLNPISSSLQIVGNPDIEIAAETNGGIVVVPFTTSDSNVTILCDEIADPCETTLILLSGETTDTGCQGGSTGTIIVTPTGGMAPYTCTWTNSAGTVIQSDGNCNIQNLAAGDYTVDVLDNNDCMASATFTINEPTVAIGITATSTPASCTTGGAIATQVTNSVGNLSYNWSGNLAGANPTNVPSGNYSVVVTDGNGCTASTSVIVASTSEVSVTGTSTDASCNGGGTITPVYTGGSGNYTYCWSDLPATGPFNLESRVGLNPGVYSVTVKDSNTGCSDIASFTIGNAVTPLNVTPGNTTDIGCDSDTGSFTYSVAGGCPDGGTYNCSLDGGPATACTGVVTGLIAGAHTLVISDGSGQSGTLNFTINGSVEPLNIIGGNNLQTTNVTCNGGEDGSLNGVNISGGCPNEDGEYTCTLNGQSVDCSMIDDVMLGAGDYTLIVTDDNTNEATATFSITESDPVVITEETVAISDVTCASALDVSVAGGSGSFIYTWTYNGDAFADTEDISDLCPGEYCLEVVDTDGCPATEIYCMTITSPVDFEGVAITSTSDNSGFGVSCLGVCDAVVSGTQISGGTDITIQLTDTEGNIEGFATFPLEGVCAGTYSMVVTDEFGGVYTHPEFIIVTEPTQIDIDIDEIIDATQGMDNGAISIFVDGGVGGNVFEWNPGDCDGLVCTDLAPGLYTVQVTDANGCSAIRVDIPVGQDSVVPPCNEGTAVITPNGDGVNDVFMISCLPNSELVGHNLAIYDRWGRLILDTDNYDNQWGGTDMDGSLLQEGGYYYVFTGDFDNGDRRIFKGSVTLLRD